MDSKRVDCSLAGKEERYSVLNRYPMRGTFFGCCASAITPRASCTTTTRIDAADFFIAHLVWSVVYHDEGGKEKCNLRLKAATFRRGKRPKLYLRLD